MDGKWDYNIIKINLTIDRKLLANIANPHFGKEGLNMDMDQFMQRMNPQDDEMAGYYYSILMSSMHVSVSKHLIDEYFTVIWANDYFYERTLYTKAEYEAKYHNRCADYFKQDMNEFNKFASAIQNAIAEGKPGYDAICRMPQKGGSYIWIKVAGTFSEERVNGIPVIYSVFTDVTEAVEQKELQKQLEEKTEQLKNALEMAEAANREKTDFLSRMSHDIRTPMNAIMGMTDIAEAHLDNLDRVKDCLRKISLSSQHLLGLINDVLDMSKIESGKMTLSNSEMSLPELMENVVAIMQPGLKEKSQQFDVRLLNMRHEWLLCDSLRLRQILINLLSNACKFTPVAGRILFEVEECPSERPGTAFFRFEISDTGIGIQPEFIGQIFDPFSRERDSRVDKTDGSGLGLAITKKIVDQMGGTISVKSQPGNGATFVIYLPFQICSGKEIAYRLPYLNILVVDDDLVVCEQTARILCEQGAAVEYETDGREAVRKAAEAHRRGEDYDAVILDWQMPGQDGIETARMIRRETGADIPILLISSYDWSEIEEKALSVGVNGFVMKPIFASTLCRKLRESVLGESAGSPGRKRKENFSGRRFLLVEDNELNREIATELLSSTGATVEYAVDGAAGVRKFEETPAGYYDLILMDVQMPVMNGYEATRKIRSLVREDAGCVPILAMTADAFAEDITEAKNSGMNGHLAKPLDFSTMVHEISKYILLTKAFFR